MSAAILQTINVMNVPQYINYGRIGFPFAHEITHGYGPIVAVFLSLLSFPVFH